MNFKKYFKEGTDAADIAQATKGSELKKRCAEEDGKDCDKIEESPVGSVGRTGYGDADNYIKQNPELVKRFKKIVKEIGGVTALRKLIINLYGGMGGVNKATNFELGEATNYCDDAKNALEAINKFASTPKRLRKAIDEVLDLLDTDC